jgi:hypothetical protein
MAVSKRLRYEILRRDDHACRYCGAKAPDVKLTVDHVIPTTLGGTDDATNLVTACAPCNAGKSSSAPDAPIVDNVADDALRWGKAMAIAAERQSLERASGDSYVQAFAELWNSWFTGTEDARRPIPRPSNWKANILQFRSAGLEQELLLEAADTALNAKHVYVNNTWRYFCGCCWRILNERQAMTRDILDQDEA